MTALIVAACVLAWIWTWGTLNAHMAAVGSTQKFVDDMYRSDLAATCALALVPIFWILSPFLTGFYENGWQLKKRNVALEGKP